MTIPMLQPKRRRSALETFDGCPYRYDVLYNRCLCGHSRKDHGPDGECYGQVNAKARRLAAGEVMIEGRARNVPCDCDHFRPVEDKGDESQRGIAFHEIAFRYIDRLAKAGLTADKGEADLAFKEGIALTQLAPSLLKDVGRLWSRHSERFELDLDAYLHAEERQETDRFTWIPDLVYIYPNRVTIKDWKTYYKGLTPDQARAEFQLKFYLLQAMDIWPNFDEYEFIFSFVRLGYEVSVVMKPEDIELIRPDVEAIVLTLNEAERTDNWPAIQGSHCGLCRLKCPLADNPLKLPVRFRDEAEAGQAFGRVLTLEQELKALKKSLGAWCNTEGPLVYHGQEYAHRPNTSRTYPAAALIDFLKDRGADVSAFELSLGDLGDIAHPKRGQRAVIEWLAEHERAITKWSFKHRKAGEVAPAGLTDALGGDDED